MGRTAKRRDRQRYAPAFSDQLQRKQGQQHKTDRQRQTGRQAGRETERQRDRETKRQRNRETEKAEKAER